MLVLKVLVYQNNSTERERGGIERERCRIKWCAAFLELKCNHFLNWRVPKLAKLLSNDAKAINMGVSSCAVLSD